ncbi:chemotaxis protein CheW [Alteromonas sediminis]|uniref:Chemotaxis protein CheW n=1 Tax=Alteromonas sediminis TaxID=2259342 RepID=A0A3N5XX99_9ALTE|nr:chemotaxis protein CheW [Alteromonas sediminis]RPJ65023.1 chemotaxis protein CheW [Alteromonas sediminis]
MGKQSSFAKEEVMEAYLESLLAGHDDVEEHQVNAAKLLASAELIDIPVPVEAPPEPPQPVSDIHEEPVITEVPEANEQVTQEPVPVVTQPVADALEETFQALFFEVAGLTMAVPLITLGGIHRLEKVGPLFGKPDWFMGVMLHRDEKLSVVDTAKWVMPEKVTAKLQDSLDYQYLIMLSDSQWGLASDKLVNTVTLQKSDVKWRQNDTKRPWLAGMVKERMCALIDVYQLISMLNRGLGRDDAQD